MDDLLPYVLCCKAGEGAANCSAYSEFRPLGNEEGYIIPVPGRELHGFFNELA